MKKEERTPNILPMPLLPEGISNDLIPTDPLGSYTGIPEEVDAIPIQDADDL